MKKALLAVLILVIVVILLLIIGKKHITTEVVINKNASAVWAELTAFDKYPDWNPFLRKLSGEVKVGNTVEVTFQARGSSPIVFTPGILQLKENELLQWEGRLFIPGIFTGRHTFHLIQIDPAKTRLVQSEEFNGILVPFFGFDSTVEGFTEMNTELKKRVEGK